MTRYVIVHGGWHTGRQFEATAAPLRLAGHDVHLPTLAGNRPGDRKDGNLSDAVASLVEFIEAHKLEDFVLVGHSYGGMVITAIADRMPECVRRLVYWNAFVPHDGQALVDLVPAHFVAMFRSLVAADGSIMLPFPVWREAFMNDASLAQAEAAYGELNPHPWASLTEPLRLTHTPAALPCAKSYLNCTEDTAMPHSLPWHPRMSEKLGLFRLVQCPGGHELCFTNPTLLGQKIMEAGRD